MTDDTDWNSNTGGGFGTHTEQDEYFHGFGPSGDSLTETWFWNFHIPEAAINCYAYCWVHPNLKVVTAGLMIYKGFKNQHLESELFDMRDFTSSEIIGDGSDIILPNGMRVQVIRPMEHVLFTFEDKARDTSFEVELKAAGIPIMRQNNKHFEQVMHATGWLVLRGERYEVNSYPVRDRSWGELRPEVQVTGPPYTWVTGAFGPDFAFNVGSHDDPARNPDWLGHFDAPARIFKDGWVVVKGEQRRVVRASKLTRREFPLCRPLVHEYQFEDSAGETYHMTGRVIAQSNWSGWSNMNCHLGLVEWTWNEQTGWGETQEVQWNDYVWSMNNRKSIAAA